MKKALQKLMLLVLIIAISGCFAPSYVGVEKPYRKERDTIFKSYFLCYDGMVALQLYPLPLCAALDTRWGDTGHTVVMSVAMPVAAAGMLVFGTLLGPIFLLLPEGWIDWDSMKRY